MSSGLRLDHVIPDEAACAGREWGAAEIDESLLWGAMSERGCQDAA